MSLTDIDRDDVEALLASTTDERIARPAAAWLRAYRIAGDLGFTERTAQIQAAGAWDIAADEVADATAIALVEVN